MPRDYYNRYAHAVQDRRLSALIDEHLAGRIADVGCGTKPYRELLAGRADQHIGLDRPDGTHGVSAVNVFADANSIPLASSSCDGVLGTNVLEHLLKPAEAVEECYRVLRPGGACIFTTPFLWHIHEAPRDYFRFTRHALEEMMTGAGFVDIQIIAVSGFWGTFGQLLAYNLHRHVQRRRWLKPILFGPILGVQLLGAALDRVDRDSRWTFLYFTLGKKPT